MAAVEAQADGDAARGRVVIADDDVLLREGLASLLERSGFDVVGQAGGGSELLELVPVMRIRAVADRAGAAVNRPPEPRTWGPIRSTRPVVRPVEL